MIGGKTLLLVEDEPNDVELTIRALRQYNIVNDVEVARDGAEALAHLLDVSGASARRSLPALVVLDLKLPKVSGLDVLKRLRANARTRALPVVVLTSSDEEADLLRSYDLGANSYIRKPVDFGQFTEVIRQLGLYWLILNEPPPFRA